MRRQQSLAHLINPVPASARADLVMTQQLTFASMRRARIRAAGAPEVTLWATGFVDDPAAPEGFMETPRLEGSVLDRGAFTTKLRLPLLGDLLERLHRIDADILVFTNVDIAVHPDFYLRVSEILSRGLDAVSINRRTVEWQRTEPPGLDWLAVQPGAPHAGHDCFVFRRGLLENVDFNNVCVGFPPVGAVLVAALSTATPRFRILEHERLTFHLNEDRPWRNPSFQEYWSHNRSAGELAIQNIARRFGSLSPLAVELRDRVLNIDRLMSF
jgi:hypothetical protein